MKKLVALFIVLGFLAGTMGIGNADTSKPVHHRTHHKRGTTKNAHKKGRAHRRSSASTRKPAGD